LPTRACARFRYTHDLASRSAHASLARFTEARFTPMILAREARAVLDTIGNHGENFRVKASVASRQISAMYACEGSTMQIALHLSSCHPLRAVEVECVQRVGVSDARWRKWQRTISTMLIAQNGARPPTLAPARRPLCGAPSLSWTRVNLGRAASFQGEYRQSVRRCVPRARPAVALPPSRLAAARARC
jgi:hypothetical protein